MTDGVLREKSNTTVALSEGLLQRCLFYSNAFYRGEKPKVLRLNNNARQDMLAHKHVVDF